MFRTVKLSFKDITTLPRTWVGVDSNSEGVMTMTSFSFVPTLQNASAADPDRAQYGLVT